MMGLIHPFTLVAKTPRVGRKAKAATAGANLKNSKAIFQNACAVVAIIPKMAVADITAKGMALTKMITLAPKLTAGIRPRGPKSKFSSRFKVAMEMRRVCFRGCMA